MGGDDRDMRRCSRCGRYFRNRPAVEQHIATVHKGKGEPMSAQREDPEPSMGTLVAEAQMARMLGEPVDEWIAEMFDV